MPRKGENKNRTGEIGCTKFGTAIKIIKYECANSIVVEVQDEYKVKVHTTYNNFKKGEVCNPYDRSVCGIGYIGEGKYKKRTHKKIYEEWKNMLKRCYDPYHLNKFPTYIDCFVHKEWHCFQNFAKWHEENYYNIEKGKMHLDKDILVKGNKVYSTETCIFVPERINTLFVKSNKNRGKYPIGVSYHKGNNTLEVHCNIIIEEGNKLKYLGSFPLNKPFQAFTSYKNFKEDYVKKVADEYKELIPKKLYDALYNYKVEVND